MKKQHLFYGLATVLVVIAAVLILLCCLRSCANQQTDVPSIGTSTLPFVTQSTPSSSGTEPTTAPQVTQPEPTPSATQPAPTEPTPTESAPIEPVPTDPPPTQPAPTDPPPTQPAPTQPVPTEPLPTNPLPAGEILAELQSYYDQNPHLVGWITIPGTPVNYPVLQTPNLQPWQNYYLNRDFYGNYSSRGSIYVRELCDVFEPSDNVVIYGHAMADNTMFGSVTLYGSRSYYEEHKYIQFNTLYERHTYEVIAVFSTSGTSGVGYPYHTKNNFRNEEAFNEFINAIRGGVPNVYSFYAIDTPVEYGDKLITLSTCYSGVHNNGRLVVVAKRIN